MIILAFFHSNGKEPVSIHWLKINFKGLQIDLALSSREINQITGGNDPLHWCNFENCESEPYINDVIDVILTIPLYCKFSNDHCTWLKDCRSAGMKIYFIYIYIYIANANSIAIEIIKSFIIIRLQTNLKREVT